MNNFELVPTEENLIKTLDEDILGRNKDLVYFYNLLMAQENASTISIEGGWGCGKTFFVKQEMLLINAKNPTNNMDEKKREEILSSFSSDFRNDTNNENDNLTIYYDAWKNDNDMENSNEMKKSDEINQLNEVKENCEIEKMDDTKEDIHE